MKTIPVVELYVSFRPEPEVKFQVVQMPKGEYYERKLDSGCSRTRWYDEDDACFVCGSKYSYDPSEAEDIVKESYKHVIEHALYEVKVPSMMGLIYYGANYGGDAAAKLAENYMWIIKRLKAEVKKYE